MSDIRNNKLKRMIITIFGDNCQVDEKKKVIVIGAGKRIDKCSFLATDKVYYIKLFNAAFNNEKIRYVDKNYNEIKELNRERIAANAIKYLKKEGIEIKCNLYCESEKALLSKYIGKILNDFLKLMFFYKNKFDEENFNKKYSNLVRYYNNEILFKGIIPSIYENKKWIDVHSNNRGEDSDGCLLIDYGANNLKRFLEVYIDTCMELHKALMYESHSYVSNDYICQNHMNLDKIIETKEENVYYLDLFHLNYDYFIPYKICYFAKLPNKAIEEEQHCDYPLRDINFNTYMPYKYGETVYDSAYSYIIENFCPALSVQYMHSLSIIADIISILTRIKYDSFYSEEYDFSNSSFKKGYEQLKQYYEKYKIKSTENDVKVIYKFLLTQWIDKFISHLQNYDFEKLFDFYENNRDCKECIEKNKNKIIKNKTFNIFDTADEQYMEFYKRNKETIVSFESSISYDINTIVIERIIKGGDYKPFELLKYEIELFQKTINYEVPCYIKENNIVKECFYGKVGETPDLQRKGFSCKFENIKLGFKDNIIEIKNESKSEDLTNEDNNNHIHDKNIDVNESPIENIKLGFKDNIIEIKNESKFEDLTNEDNNDHIHDKNIDVKEPPIENINLTLKNNQKYLIEFEANGIENVSYSLIIIKVDEKRSEIVFENDNIKLSENYNRFSFEFDYDGETCDKCYFLFGCGQNVGEYSVKNLKISTLE